MLLLYFSYQNRTDVYVDDQLTYKDNYLLADTGAVPVGNVMRHFQVKKQNNSSVHFSGIVFPPHALNIQL